MVQTSDIQTDPILKTEAEVNNVAIIHLPVKFVLFLTIDLFSFFHDCSSNSFFGFVALWQQFFVILMRMSVYHIIFFSLRLILVLLSSNVSLYLLVILVFLLDFEPRK